MATSSNDVPEWLVDHNYAYTSTLFEEFENIDIDSIFDGQVI